MKVLIITTCYPPDTAIAAIRPYMFAKYLKQYGHEVTVLRSGLLQQSADRSFAGHEGIRVITYLGKNSPAERFEWGQSDFMQYSPASGDSRISFLPESLRRIIAKVYHILVAPYDFYQWFRKDYWQGRFEPMKTALDRLATEQFDVVFSTYGAVENIWGGQYASKLFGAKWIQDFRDPIEPHSPNAFGVPFLRRIQKNAVRKADICTAVSDDLAEYLSHQAGGKNVYTLYNGYEPIDTGGNNAETVKGQLSFCYTGTVYEGKQSFASLLKALRRLCDEGRVSQDKVRIHYAGKDFDSLQNEASAYSLSDVLVNHGYVSRAEAVRIQNLSDLFLVLSWNAKREKGVLTGKFYEGIRAKKPILAMLTGKVSNSELYRINEKYHYGFCYESCREKEQFDQFCDYLEMIYQQKMQSGMVDYAPNPNLETDFRYDVLSKKLEDFCLILLQQNNHEV